MVDLNKMGLSRVGEGVGASYGAAAAGASPNLFTGISLGSVRNNFDGCVGVGFATDIGVTPTVTHLSRWKVAGNSQTHTLYLVDNDPSFSIVASVSVDMSTGSAGSWVSAALGTPQILLANHIYYILSSETNGGDGFYDDDTTIGGWYAGINGSNSAYDTSVPPTAIATNTASPAIFVPVNAVLT